MSKLGRFVLFLSLVALPLAAQAAVINGQITLAADGAALPGVTVTVDGQGASAVTDADGKYELTVDGVGGAVRVTAYLQGFQSKTATVDVSSGNATQNFALQVSYGQEITVGSRAIGAESEKAVPVDVIPQEQIASAPSTETSQIIQKIAPSFNFPRPTITDGTDTVRPATLRGLGPDQVLVMVNGKRRHASALVNVNSSVGRGSSGVDLNAIPASAIENIEILRDGAAAQYGSDAIAGVINLVLKSDAAAADGHGQDGRRRRTRDGQMHRPQPRRRLEHRPRRALRHRRVSRPLRDQPRRRPIRAIRSSPATPATTPCRSRTTHWGDSYARDVMALRQLQPAARRRTASRSSTRSAASATGTARTAASIRRALQAQNWPPIYPLGFLPLIEPRVTDQSLTGGVRGELASWYYDASVGYGRNKFDFYVTDSLNTSLGPVDEPDPLLRRRRSATI